MISDARDHLVSLKSRLGVLASYKDVDANVMRLIHRCREDVSAAIYELEQEDDWIDLDDEPGAADSDETQWLTWGPVYETDSLRYLAGDDERFEKESAIAELDSPFLQYLARTQDDRDRLRATLHDLPHDRKSDAVAGGVPAGKRARNGRAAAGARGGKRPVRRRTARSGG